jgi:hypothetical protein
MSKVLPISAAIEVATGVALLVVPSLFGQLLLAHELSGAAIPVARVAGIALIALGLACWPRRHECSDLSPALRAMLFYNLFVALYLTYLGIGRQGTGPLLWPAVGLHALILIVLGRDWIMSLRSGERDARTTVHLT